MNAAETTATATAISSPRLLLEKPLAELTEEDIAQLTREDCRRFLKDKGMRRPSWNKSQAIQQVISLKALLEVPPDDSPDPAGDRPKPPSPSPPWANSLPPPPPPAAKDPSPYRRRDPIPPPPLFSAGAASNPRLPLANLRPSPPEERATGAAAPASMSGQMTIFYGGRVNVYDGVPAEKARAIMRIAASPDQYDTPQMTVPLSRPLQTRLTPAAHLSPGRVPGFLQPPAPVKPPPKFADNVDCGQPRDSETEGPTGRKASLQRYLEKRKDRYKGKRIIGGSSSSMEMMYLSRKFMVQAPHEQSTLSNTGSPTHPRPPHTPTRCSSIENRTQKLRISVDLNEDGGGN